MSKQRRSRRKQSQQGIAIPKKWFWVIGIVFTLILISVVVAISASPPPAPEVTGAPAIEVEQTHFDLGEMRFNQMAQVTYRIKNVGDQPLEITEIPNVQVLEGC